MQVTVLIPDKASAFKSINQSTKPTAYSLNWRGKKLNKQLDIG